MAAEGSTSVAPPAPAVGADSSGPVARWAMADPVRAVGLALILVQLLWRAQIGSRGFLAIDDFALASHAHESSLRAGYLFGLFNNHLMPGGLLLSWLVTKWVGLAYWPYLLIMLAGQAAVDLALFRLLRRMLLPGWALLVPLVLFLFNPLTLEASSWWAVGVNLLPMQLSMVLAIGSHRSYLRTRRRRHLLGTVLSVVLGLLFFEKSLLVVPLLFLVTACLYVRGGPLRSGWEALRRYWPAWLALFALMVGYLAVYLGRSQTSVREPSSAAEVATFVRQIFGSTVLPGLVGGPWRWLAAGDGAPVTAPDEVTRWLAWAAVLAVTAGTTLVRRSAARAWLLLYIYLGLDIGLIGSTRLGSVFSAVAGLVPRYVSDVVVVAAICVGAAVLGVAEPAPGQTSRPLPVAFRARSWLAGGLLAALGVYLLGAGWSGARFGDEWAHKAGRDYLRAALADLATAPQDTAFFDAPVPEAVVGPLSAPYNQQSRFFAPAKGRRPRYVTATAQLSAVDNAGHVQPGGVSGVRALPGPESGCGYKLTGTQSTVTIPLQHEVFDWRWAIRIAYLANGDTTATFKLGDAVRSVPVERGLHAYFFLVDGGGAQVDLSLDDPSVTLCTDEIMIGNPVPAG